MSGESASDEPGEGRSRFRTILDVVYVIAAVATIVGFISSHRAGVAWYLVALLVILAAWLVQENLHWRQRARRMRVLAAATAAPSGTTSRRLREDALNTKAKIEALTKAQAPLMLLVRRIAADGGTLRDYNYNNPINDCRTVVQEHLGAAELASLDAFEVTNPTTTTPPVPTYYEPMWRMPEAHVRWIAMRIEQLREADPEPPT